MIPVADYTPEEEYKLCQDLVAQCDEDEINRYHQHLVKLFRAGI